MQSLCRFVTGRLASRIIVLVALLLTAFCAFYARRVEQDDNVLAFLPQKNPEVRAFYDVSARFGSLDVAIVGIASEDVFARDFLVRLARTTKLLNQTEGIDYALSLTSVDDISPDPKGGISRDYLVSKPPENQDEHDALRARVLANENVVGNLVSSDGKGLVIYCFLRHGVDPHAGAAQVRRIVSQAFSEPTYWGGSPFISTYIYDITQRDLKRLAPWACLAIVLLILASFRDVSGMLLALASTAMGIVMTLGTMGFLGMRSNIVLGSIPVILFALGSAPPVHILTRYYVHRRDLGTAEAIAEALRDKGAVVIASAITVIAGLASFMTMDIAPMRTFGLFTSLGIALTLVSALIFVPAAISVLELRGRAKIESALLARVSEKLVLFARRRKVLVAVGLGLLAAVCAFGVNRVDTLMDNDAFFEKTSEPALAEAFLGEHFGGSEFVQVMVEGDMENPYVLREVQRLGDQIASLPDVAGVNHLGQVLSTANDAMEGVKRIPNTTPQAKLLLSFLAGNRAVSQMVTDDRKSALINIKLATTDIDRVERVLSTIESLSCRSMASTNGQDEATNVRCPATVNGAGSGTVQAYVLADAHGPRGAEVKASQDAFVLSHVLTVLRKTDNEVDAKKDAIRKALRSSSETPDPAGLANALNHFMRSDEFTGDVPTGPPATASTNDETSDPSVPSGKKTAAPDATPPAILYPADPIRAIAEGVAVLPNDPTPEALRGAIARAIVRRTDDAAVKDIAESLIHPLSDIQRREARHGASLRILEAAATPATQREALAIRIGDSLSDLDLDKGLLPAAGGASDGSITTTVTGLPVLYRGLSRSVESNQIISLLSAAGLVALTMTILFRSLWSGLLSAIPALFTIFVVYGGMGLMHIHLDIGTSMLASLIIGAGVDYAIHFLGGWRAPPNGSVDEGARQAAQVTGPGVWTNALMVSAGFFVLTLGEARPLKHVGGLTAVAMIAAAVSTFLLVPVFARKRSYIRESASSAAGIASPPSIENGSANEVQS